MYKQKVFGTRVKTSNCKIVLSTLKTRVIGLASRVRVPRVFWEDEETEVEKGRRRCNNLFCGLVAAGAAPVKRMKHAFPNYTDVSKLRAAAADEPICFSGLQHSPDSPYSTCAREQQLAERQECAIGQQRTDMRVDLPIAAHDTRPFDLARLGWVVLLVCLHPVATRGCVVSRVGI